MKATFKRGKSLKGVDSAIRSAVNAQADVVEGHLDNTVKTWSGDKPSFPPKDASSGGNLVVRVEPQGSQEAVDKWRYLELGTRVRRVLLSPDWKSKTSPRNLNSGPGSGFVVGPSPRPLPGIESREWRKTVVEQEQSNFKNRVRKAIDGV